MIWNPVTDQWEKSTHAGGFYAVWSVNLELPPSPRLDTWRTRIGSTSPFVLRDLRFYSIRPTTEKFVESEVEFLPLYADGNKFLPNIHSIRLNQLGHHPDPDRWFTRGNLFRLFSDL